jgi:hypothetical protein
VQKCEKKLGEASMKNDAFDDLRCPFNYKKELKNVRDALNEKVMECVSRDWELGYRELAKGFNISAGTLLAIAKEHKKKQKLQSNLRKALMKEDAFDDLQCPFNYKKELKESHEALNRKLIECVSRPWRLGYRELAKKFGISTGRLFNIAKEHKKKQKPGPRKISQ